MYPGNDQQHLILNELYLEAAADLLSGGFNPASDTTRDHRITGAVTTYVSVLGANGEGIALSSMLKIEQDLLASIHPLSPAPISQTDLEDWCRELNNQLVGRLKNKLLRRNVAVCMGLPVLLAGTDVNAVAAPDLTINEHHIALDKGYLHLTLSSLIHGEVDLRAAECVSEETEAFAEGSIALF